MRNLQLLDISRISSVLYRAVVAHDFNPNTLEVEAGELWVLIPALWETRQENFEFKASLAYKESSRTVSTTQRNSVSKNTKTNNTKEKRKNKQTNKATEKNIFYFYLLKHLLLLLLSIQ